MGENRLRVFKSGLLTKILGPHKEIVTGNWRKLHNMELHDFTPHQPLIGSSNELG